MSMNGDQMDTLEEVLDALGRDDPEEGRKMLQKLDRDQLVEMCSVLHEVQSLLIEEIFSTQG